MIKNNNIIYYTLYTYIINNIRIWVARVPWQGQGPAGTHAPNDTSVAICTSGAWGGRFPIITLSLLSLLLILLSYCILVLLLLSYRLLLLSILLL